MSRDLDRLERIARQARDKGIRDVPAYTEEVINAAGGILLDDKVPPAIRTEVRRVAKTLLHHLADGAEAALEDIADIQRSLRGPKHKHDGEMSQ